MISFANWLGAIGRGVGGISILSLFTLMKRKDLFMRIIGDTNRSYYKAWNKCLPSITPQEIAGKNRSVSLIIDRQKMGLNIQDMIPILEILQLSEAKNILEIGTSNGGTTWHLAANAVKGASITTVDLPPTASHRTYNPRKLSSSRPTENELGCHFRGTPEAKVIKQILIDSKDLLKEVGGHNFDFIFIDGAHTYEYVTYDTENVLKLINGVCYIIWHDYFVFRPYYGLMQYLNELNSKEITIYHLHDSSCAISCVMNK